MVLDEFIRLRTQIEPPFRCACVPSEHACNPVAQPSPRAQGKWQTGCPLLLYFRGLHKVSRSSVRLSLRHDASTSLCQNIETQEGFPVPIFFIFGSPSGPTMAACSASNDQGRTINMELFHTIATHRYHLTYHTSDLLLLRWWVTTIYHSNRFHCTLPTYLTAHDVPLIQTTT